MNKTMVFGAAICGLFALPALAGAPDTKPASKLELVHNFNGPMVTGVTVSRRGRIFANFPRWGDKVVNSVVEIEGNREVAFPDKKWNTLDTSHLADCLVSVQSVVVDPKDRLWILDTGSIQFMKTKVGGPKLIGVDLATNKVFKTIVFPQGTALPTTYLNDIRFDLQRGTEGMAFITDSASEGPNGIIVVDLGTGKSWRRLNNHPSTKAEPNFVPTVEGQPLMQREPGQPPKPITMGSDGIAISADGKKLYYCPLASRRLYSVSVDALADETQTEEQVAAAVQDVGIKGASDGLETDAEGRIYATDYEHRAILRRASDGKMETVIQDSRIVWPDTLSIAANNYLYFTNNQLNRQARYHNGKDLRRRPYQLYRVPINSGPIALR